MILSLLNQRTLFAFASFLTALPGGEVAQEGQHVSKGGNNWMIEDLTDSHTLEIQPFGPIHLPTLPPIQVLGITVDLSPTKYLIFLWIAALIVTLGLILLARRKQDDLVPRGWKNVIDVFIVFIRDEVIIPTIGHEGIKFLPFLLTLFFFILTSNLLGLIPDAITPTGNINVTAGLALISFLVIQGSGIAKHGLIGYFRGLVPPGIPFFVIPIMVAVEFIGLFTKPFALTVRLFANMTAGHIVIFSLIGLIFLFKTVAVAPISIGFALFIYFMEIMIAFIQAYIFTILTALFIGLAVHQEH